MKLAGHDWCVDEELDYATRFSCALGLAELQLEEGNQSAAAEVLKAIEPMAPKHNPAAALQYVQLLQRADCQVGPVWRWRSVWREDGMVAKSRGEAHG